MKKKYTIFIVLLLLLGLMTTPSFAVLGDIFDFPYFSDPSKGFRMNGDVNIFYTPKTATGYFQILSGNMKIGDTAPTYAQDGEDLFVEGKFEVDGATYLGALTLTGDLSTDSLIKSITIPANSLDFYDTDGNIKFTSSTGKKLVFQGGSASSLLYVSAGSVQVGIGTPTNAISGGDCLYVLKTGEFDGILYSDGGIRTDATYSANTALLNYFDMKDGSSDIIFGTSAGNDFKITLGATTDLLKLTQGGFLVGAGVPTITLNTGDVFVSDSAEIDGMAYLDGGAKSDEPIGSNTSPLNRIDFKDASSDILLITSATNDFKITLGDSSDLVKITQGGLTLGAGVPTITPGTGDIYATGTVEVDDIFYPDGGVETDATIGSNSAPLNCIDFKDGSSDVLITTSATNDVKFNLGADTDIIKITQGGFQAGNGTPDWTLNTGDVFISGTAECDGDAKFDGSLSLNGNQTTGGTLTVTGLSSLNGGVTTTTIDASGMVNFTDSLGVTGNITAGGDITATGDVSGANGIFTIDVSASTGTFSGSVTASDGVFTNDVSGSTATFTGTISGGNGTFSGDVNITGSLTSGGIDTTDIVASGNISCATFDCTGQATFGSTIGVTGDATFLEDIAVTGEGSFGTINCTGQAVFGSTASFTGDVDFSSGIDVAGLGKFGSIDCAGQATFGSTASFTGDVDFSSGIDVAGLGEFGTIDCAGQATFGSTASFTGEVAFNDGFTVSSGNSTFNDIVGLNATVSLADNIEFEVGTGIGGFMWSTTDTRINVTGDVYFDDNVEFSDTVTVDDNITFKLGAAGGGYTWNTTTSYVDITGNQHFDNDVLFDLPPAIPIYLANPYNTVDPANAGAIGIYAETTNNYFCVNTDGTATGWWIVTMALGNNAP